ncbi:Rhodanese-like domain-containing protein, partial [Melampsora americana]
ICPSTMDELISGMYQEKISKKFIIDCRSSNEFEGGHIKGAKNISDSSIIDQKLFSTERIQKAIKLIKSKKPIVLIFHCEFSAIRGPKMASYVRERDEELHGSEGLIYKEIYILDGGYAKY